MEVYTSFTKHDIVNFANDFFKENYIIVNKEKGTNDKLIRVGNPGITPVKINRDAQSEFLKEILADKTESIQPKFIDYQKEIITDQLNGKQLSYVKIGIMILRKFTLFFHLEVIMTGIGVFLSNSYSI